MIHCSLFRSIKTVWHYAVSSFWWQRSLQQLYYASQGYNCNSFIYNWIVLWLQHQSNIPSWVTSEQQRPTYCITRINGRVLICSIPSIFNQTSVLKKLDFTLFIIFITIFRSVWIGGRQPLDSPRGVSVRKVNSISRHGYTYICLNLSMWKLLQILLYCMLLSI